MNIYIKLILNLNKVIKTIIQLLRSIKYIE